MASKLELAAILAAACGMLSIEHGNHTFTNAPTRTERSALAAADCPGNDSMPYPESCLIFLDAKLESDVRHLDAAGKSALAQPDAVKQDESILPDAECPAKDTVPYSASCIAFFDRLVLATPVILRGGPPACSTIASRHCVPLGTSSSVTNWRVTGRSRAGLVPRRHRGDSIFSASARRLSTWRQARLHNED